ncbi:MAG: glycine/betaine ABC transporter [Rhodospirillaceae bacterium TMED8]|nr:glycine/betaine ABC transporter [Magnetovibrio sp.]OUT51118.1 MAG: glycine/betaine ABC transporter [Rhodospirillaceae bacterium TMED8]
MMFETNDRTLKNFVRTNTEYYQREFNKIGAKSGYKFSFNVSAALYGPIWFGARNIWNYALAFLIIETFCFVQLVRGSFGDITKDARDKIEKIQSTIDFRNQQLLAAKQNNSDKVEVYERAINSLERAMEGYVIDINTVEESAIWIALSGVFILVFAKFLQGIIGNIILEKRYSDWLSDHSIDPGMTNNHFLLSVIFTAIIMCLSVINYSFPGYLTILDGFPTHPDIRIKSINWVESSFDLAVLKGDALFTTITIGIRSVLDFLELIFVTTPWIVIITAIVVLTALSAGIKTAIYSAAFLSYMGFLGFWEKAMTTLALLGTAALLSIAIGIPLGIFCARRYRFYAVIRPIMDFMQTMPAFVFMIPVIAFFGTGKVAAVIITMIFGGTPVVRLTVLGLRGVDETIREAAIAYGASNWYLLRKIDLPLAAPSILAGVNQTVMLSLAMVVVASLIGAKGLGQDVLEALQYANVGQGILAGVAILFVALILDRVVQGKKRV